MGIGDINSEEKGSGARYNDGKPDWSLMPMHLLEGTVRVWMYGAKKYAAWNWAKGMAWSVPYACALRHLFAWYRGEEIDPESGQSHLDHVICNILMLKHYEDKFKEGDDRPKEQFSDTPSGSGRSDGVRDTVDTGTSDGSDAEQGPVDSGYLWDRYWAHYYAKMNNSKRRQDGF